MLKNAKRNYLCKKEKKKYNEKENAKERNEKSKKEILLTKEIIPHGKE